MRGKLSSKVAKRQRRNKGNDKREEQPRRKDAKNKRRASRARRLNGFDGTRPSEKRTSAGATSLPVLFACYTLRCYIFAVQQTGVIPVKSERQAMDWSLVLVSQGIESTIERVPESDRWQLSVPSGDYARAVQALRQYHVENK